MNFEKPIVLPDTVPVYFDVDDTLAMWVLSKEQESEDDVTVTGLRLRPHKQHIAMVKFHYDRGRTIIAWSDGGSEWAHDVLKALEIVNYFTIIMGKPKWAYDDKQPTEWTRTFFIPEDTPRMVQKPRNPAL